MPQEYQDSLTDLDRLVQLASDDPTWGVAYVSHGVLTAYSTSMYDGTSDKIFVLNVSSPSVAKDLVKRYRRTSSTFIPILLTSSLEDVLSRIQHMQKKDRSSYVERYLGQFTQQKGKYLSVFENSGNPDLGEFSVGERVKSIAERISILLLYSLTEWKDYTAIPGSKKVKGFNFKEEFHTHFVNYIINKLYRCDSVDNLKTGVGRYNSLRDGESSTQRTQQSHFFSGLQSQTSLALMTKLGYSHSQLNDGLYLLSPRQVSYEEGVVVISHHIPNLNDTDESKLKRLFAEVLAMQCPVFTSDYIASHFNGSFKASLTDDNLNYSHTIQFKFVKPSQ